MVRQQRDRETADQQQQPRDYRENDDGASDSHEGLPTEPAPKRHKRGKYVSKAWYGTRKYSVTATSLTPHVYSPVDNAREEKSKWESHNALCDLSLRPFNDSSVMDASPVDHVSSMAEIASCKQWTCGAEDQPGWRSLELPTGSWPMRMLAFITMMISMSIQHITAPI